MPPVTKKQSISTEGLAAKNSIAEVRQNVNLGATPAEARSSLSQIKTGPTVTQRFNPTIPDVIPSTALAGNKTFEDVMDTRADLETQATAKQQLTDRIKGTTDRIGTPTPTALSNPDAIINRLSLNRVPSETESQRTVKQASAVQNRRDYAGDIATARQDLGTEYGLPDLTARKAEVTQQYAERQNQLDADIKRIEDNASKRGVDRTAVEDMKNATKSAALEDLSNLAAIEAAVSGSINDARNIINDSINDKKSAFELENQAIQQEIDYLSTLVGEDNKREADQLQIALDERKRLQETQLAKETAIRNYAADVAAEGADDGTINAILKSGTEEEALRYAAPLLGRTARRQAEANIAQSYASIQASNQSILNSQQNNLIERAKLGDTKALQSLGITPDTSGYIKVDTKEAQGVQKEIIGNDAYKAIRKGQDSLLALNAFEKLFKEVGTTSGVTSPIENRELTATYNAAILNLKEFFNLGVLNGPDEAILKGVLPDPTGQGFVTNPFAKEGTVAGIQNMKDQIEQTLDDRYLSVKSQYSRYNPSEITVLNDLDRVYLQNKMSISPEVTKFIEDNPDMPLDEVLQVINSKI